MSGSEAEAPVSAELLALLRCPESRQKLFLATAKLLRTINSRLPAGTLRDRAGTPINPSFQAGLVREDGEVFYEIRDGIPVLIVGEGIALNP